MSGNLLDALPVDLPEELFTVLAEADGVRVERIVSNGQASPEGFWYDQEWAELVLLVAGAAGLEMEGEAVGVLVPGDWLVIPAHARHRVAWTDPDRPTVWLAVHYRG
ncbi:cupin [Azospirillum sp.]|uniref:cupin n=1 Tax=Azospirillum sp. TaxID=34012 RepID=UPI003D745942